LPVDFNVQERDQLIDLSCDGGLKSEFNKDLLIDFWLKIKAECGLISDRVLKFLILFSKSYLCETGFFCYACNKKQMQNLNQTYI